MSDPDLPTICLQFFSETRFFFRILRALVWYSEAESHRGDDGLTVGI